MHVTQHHPGTAESSSSCFFNYKIFKNLFGKFSRSGIMPRLHQVLSEQSNPWHMLKKLNLYMVGMLDLKVCAVFSSAQRSEVVRGYKRQTVLTNWNNLCNTSCVAASKLHNGWKSTDTLLCYCMFELRWSCSLTVYKNKSFVTTKSEETLKIRSGNLKPHPYCSKATLPCG